jgi:hypothetical protein
MEWPGNKPRPPWRKTSDCLRYDTVKNHYRANLEISGQLHVLAALSLHKEAPGTHLRGGCVGPTANLDTDEQRKISGPSQKLKTSLCASHSG